MSVIRAVLSLVPDAEVTVRGNDVDSIEWHSKHEILPTKDEILQEIDRIAERDALEFYKHQRKLEYPPIGDQLDALFHAGLFPDDLAAQIQAVKDAYPKPESD